MDHRQKRNSRWSFHRVCTGAPQGCVLSPLFFCLHTNNCMSLHTTYPGPGLAGPVVRSQQPGANPTTNDPRPLQYTQQHYVSWWTIFQDLKWDSYIKKTQQKMNFLHQLRKFNGVTGAADPCCRLSVPSFPPARTYTCTESGNKQEKPLQIPYILIQLLPCGRCYTVPQNRTSFSPFPVSLT